MGEGGAARIVYAYEQTPDPNLPYVPRPERNPYSGVVEAMRPAGVEPVRDERWAHLGPLTGRLRPGVDDPMIKEVAEVEARLRSELEVLHARVKALERGAVYRGRPWWMKLRDLFWRVA